MSLPVSQRCNDESFSAAQIFIHVGEVDIRDRNNTLVFILFKVEPRLLEPLEIGGGLNMHTHLEEFNHIHWYESTARVIKDRWRETEPIFL